MDPPSSLVQSVFCTLCKDLLFVSLYASAATSSPLFVNNARERFESDKIDTTSHVFYRPVFSRKISLACRTPEKVPKRNFLFHLNQSVPLFQDTVTVESKPLRLKPHSGLEYVSKTDCIKVISLISGTVYLLFPTKRQQTAQIKENQPITPQTATP